MYKCTLPHFIDLQEYVEILEFLEEAHDMDIKRKEQLEKLSKHG
jgi:hypothetical protein